MITIASWLGITWCLLTTLIEGYPFGAPPTRCGAMIPGHNGTMPQAVPPPYTITVSNTTLSPGQSVLGKLPSQLYNLYEVKLPSYFIFSTGQSV